MAFKHEETQQYTCTYFMANFAPNEDTLLKIKHENDGRKGALTKKKKLFSVAKLPSSTSPSSTATETTLEPDDDRGVLCQDIIHDKVSLSAQEYTVILTDLTFPPHIRSISSARRVSAVSELSARSLGHTGEIVSGTL